jgi:hypothetical protein
LPFINTYASSNDIYPTIINMNCAPSTAQLLF